MMNDVLKKFIIREVGIRKDELSSDKIRIEEDLGVYGDDAVELIIAYGKEFNVDVSNFMLAEYFSPEGLDIFGGLVNLITGKQQVKKVLTFGHLEKAIIAGRLDEEIIKN